MRTVTSSVDLNATPQKVWGLLTDTNQHSSWNPFITRMKGSLRIGSKLEVRIEPPGRLTSSEKARAQIDAELDIGPGTKNTK